MDEKRIGVMRFGYGQRKGTFKMKWMMKYLFLGALMAASLAVPGVVRAQVETPTSFDGFLVYMANGQFDASVPNEATGAQFQEIMGRSDEEVAAELQRAEGFFRDSYGVDFTGVEAVDGIKTVGNAMLDTNGFMLDPRIEYRAYQIAGYEVPVEGWVVRDGGWMVNIGEGGALLTGTFGGDEGIEAPEGSFIVFGDYNIDTGDEPIVIHYQSGSPILPMGIDGIMAFSCDLSSELWGEGRANGTVLMPADQGDGTVKMSYRNVLTFPAR